MRVHLEDGHHEFIQALGEQLHPPTVKPRWLKIHYQCARVDLFCDAKDDFIYCPMPFLPLAVLLHAARRIRLHYAERDILSA